MTDFAIALGGWTNEDNYGKYFTKTEDSNLMEVIEEELSSGNISYAEYEACLKDFKYAKIKYRENSTNTRYISVISNHDSNNSVISEDIEDYTIGTRPIIRIKDLNGSLLVGATRNAQGILEIEYGEYPQYAVNSQLQHELEKSFKAGNLAKTEKSYEAITNKGLQEDGDTPTEDYDTTKFQEYITEDGKKYIRVQYLNKERQKLSNGITPKNEENDVVWIEVQPVKWFIDEENKIAISENILLSGCPFIINNSKAEKNKFNEVYYNGDFDIFSDIVRELGFIEKSLEPSKNSSKTNSEVTHQNSFFVAPNIVEAIITSNKEMH